MQRHLEVATQEAAAARNAAAKSKSERDAARSELAHAQAEIERIRVAVRHPVEVMVDPRTLDASVLRLDSAQASLAGPDSFYVTSIEYDGQLYSALLRYRGGSNVTVEKVFGASGKLIPDTVGLAQTRLQFVAPNTLHIAYVDVDGQGYSMRLLYRGDNHLEVTEIRRVTLPPTAAE